MMSDFQALSMQGTLAFARLGILLLFLAHLAIWFGTASGDARLGMATAILCAGASYGSQLSATHARERLAVLLQLAAIAAALWSFWLLLAGTA